MKSVLQMACQLVVKLQTTDYCSMYRPSSVWRHGVTSCGSCVSFYHPCLCLCLLCWRTCLSTSHLSACWHPKSASFMMQRHLVPSVPGKCCSMGSFASSSASPASSSVSPSVSHPASSSESLAVTCHGTSSFCASSSPWSSKETCPSHQWGCILLCLILWKAPALFHVLAEFLLRCEDHVQAFATPIIGTIVPAHDMIEIGLVIVARILAKQVEGESP